MLQLPVNGVSSTCAVSGRCMRPAAVSSMCSTRPGRSTSGPHAPSWSIAYQHALRNPWLQQPRQLQQPGAPWVCRAKFSPTDGTDVKEKHRIFDEVVIVVKSGDGGNGEVVEAGRGKWVQNNKYHAGGNQPKKLWLSASDPADGADGADVILVCDPNYDSLLHLHKRKEYAAPRGSNANPAVGSSGPKKNQGIKKAVTPPMEIPVPPGTLVKRKRNGAVLGELLRPGQRLLVAAGGRGGLGVRTPSKELRQARQAKEMRSAAAAGGEVVIVDDTNWKADAKGLPGVQLSLQLQLRVVADVGIVGFPNAGKSSLLSCLTRATPEVAPYPFTTLMPNLGVMAAGQGPVLADLPGLIEGAHVGKGLGRMFLRHLRRTRVLLHVVDASAADPATDYLAVREELRMYNPDYCARPHVVALNKMDLEDAGALAEEVAAEVAAAGRRLVEQYPDQMGPPAAIVACSAATGQGLAELAAALQKALGVEPSREQRAVAQWEEMEAQLQGAAVNGQAHEAAASSSSSSSSSSSAVLSAVSSAFAAAAGDMGQKQDSGGPAAAATAAAGDHDDVDDDFEDDYDVLGHAGEHPAGHKAWGSMDEDEVEGEEEEEGEWTAAEEAELQALMAAAAAADAELDEEGDGEMWEGGAGPEEEEEEEEEQLPPLDPNDPDAWLFALSEEELLKLEQQE